MPADTAVRPRSLAAVLTLDRAAVLAFVAISAVYFRQATTLAAHAPFWMDEILTLRTARLPDAAAIWSALVHGAEFTPPLGDLLVHAVYRAGITGALGLRAVSIAAIYVAALATGAIVRRHAGTAPAALAAGVMLSSGLFGYAVQVRPYALVTAAFAGALMLHDRPGRASNRRIVAIGMLLALAIGLHFYALLLAGALTLVELVKASSERRKPDARLLIAIAIAAGSILLYWPILHAARMFSAVDVAAPDYYARPTLAALVDTYTMLLGWLVVPLSALLAARLVRPHDAIPLERTAVLVAAIPLGVFLFALLVSHSYAERYALSGMIGIAMLFGIFVRTLGRHADLASVAILLLLIVMAPWRDRGEIGKTDRIDALATVAAAPTADPIVTGSGLRFLELREAFPGRRIVFLDTPGTESPDPTNRNQVLRWAAIDPALEVADARAFLCAHPSVSLFAQPATGGADPLPLWLARHADLTPPPAGRASLTRVHARPCPHGSRS